MNALDERDDLTDDDAVMAHRGRARNLLPQITQQVRQALNDADIDLDVFLMIPASGDAVATFGTVADPDDELWKRVTEIVSSILRETVGLGRTRCREVICATTHDTSRVDRRYLGCQCQAQLCSLQE